MATMVSAGEALARGLRAEFVDTYKSRLDQVNTRLALVMDLDVPSDKLTEEYAYPESAPHPVRWPRGQNPSDQAFGFRSWTVTNYDWVARIPWHANDEADDQTRSLVQQAQQAGSNFALLPERVFFQILLGTTDLDLLPAAPQAPDGVALFSSSTRFGNGSGNIVSGDGVATVAAILTNLYEATARATLFQDTQGQPLLPQELLQTVLVIHGASNEEVFDRAFNQRIQQGTQAGVSNVVLDTNRKVVRWSTPRITDNDWFVVFPDVKHRPLFRQTRQPLQDNMEDFRNSDRTRDTKVKRLQFDARYGFGCALPYNIIKIDN